MIRLSVAAVATLCAFSANAASQLERVRGSIESSADGHVSVRTSEGGTEQITVAPDTKFAWVIKSTLDAIKDNTFIGTATKGDNPPVALEVVIFPEAMRGTGEGHYAWDSIADTTMSSDSKAKSAMTNGTVKATPPKPMTNSAMTNGAVKASGPADGAKTLTVTYDNGQSLDVQVPTTAPIVMFERADKSVVKVGARVFIIAAKDGGVLTAKSIAVGKDGITPPM